MDWFTFSLSTAFWFFGSALFGIAGGIVFAQNPRPSRVMFCRVMGALLFIIAFLICLAFWVMTTRRGVQIPDGMGGVSSFLPLTFALVAMQIANWWNGDPLFQTHKSTVIVRRK